jgi:hypothetical protein
MVRIDYVVAVPKMGDSRHVALRPRSYREVSGIPAGGRPRKEQIMNVRAFLAVPAALALAVLAGCGVSEGETGNGPGTGSARVRMPSTEVCHEAGWIREHAPEGVCSTQTERLEDNLSPLKRAW